MGDLGSQEEEPQESEETHMNETVRAIPLWVLREFPTCSGAMATGPGTIYFAAPREDGSPALLEISAGGYLGALPVMRSQRTAGDFEAWLRPRLEDAG